MKKVLVIVLMFLSASFAFSQSDSGIFLTVKCGKGTQKHVVMITNKQVCLAPNPIIAITEISSVSDLVQANGKVWFDMELSQKAEVTLSQIASSLPNTTFALVVEKDVFYVFPASDLKSNRKFRFQGGAKDSFTFSQIQKRLKTAVDAKPQ